MIQLSAWNLICHFIFIAWSSNALCPLRSWLLLHSVFSYKKAADAFVFDKANLSGLCPAWIVVVWHYLINSGCSFVCFFSLQRKKTNVSKANNSICVYSKIWLRKHWPLVYVLFFFFSPGKAGVATKTQGFLETFMLFTIKHCASKTEFLDYWVKQILNFKSCTFDFVIQINFDYFSPNHIPLILSQLLGFHHNQRFINMTS